MLTEKEIQEIRKEIEQLQIHIKACELTVQSILKRVEAGDRALTKRQENKIKKEAEMRTMIAKFDLSFQRRHNKNIKPK